ncbi:hypothetical protein C3L33_17438, partial [Rhododendron williamsianum]
MPAASTPLTKHLTVAIIDSNPTLGKEECFKKDDPPDPRVSTVTPALFPFSKVWDYTGLGYTRYNARDVDKEVLGCVVENKVLHRSLLSCIQDTDSQKTIYPSRLTSMNLAPSLSSMRVDGTSSGPSMSTSGGLAKLELADGNSLYAKLVVGADGSKSRVRELADSKQLDGSIHRMPSSVLWNIKRITIVRGNISTFGSNCTFANRANVTSSASECFEVPPKVVKLASERMVFPLSLMHANQYASRRVVLIGDAAHTVHPLAGQGVNLGFGDAAALSRTIAEGVKVSLLKRYEADRKLANLTMMAILDGFQKAYSVDFGPLNVLRAAAFHGASIYHH